MSISKASSVIEALRADGVARIDGFLDPARIEALKREVADFYFAGKPGRRGRYEVNPLHLARKADAAKLPIMIKSFRNEMVRDICRAILGHGWFVPHIVLDYSDDASKPIVTWHVDNSEPGKMNPDYFVLKFQIYLDSARPDSGATAYARGSHRLISFMREQLIEIKRNDIAILEYPDVVRAWDALRAARVAIPPELEALYETMCAQIRTGVEPNAAAFGGDWAAGSMMIFNDNGFHWAGPVKDTHRFLIRYYVRAVRRQELLHPSRDAAALWLRMAYAAVPGQSLRPLLFNI